MMVELFVPKFVPFFLILVTCFLFLVSYSNAQSLDDQIAQLTKQISDLESSISPLRKESTNLQSQITQTKNTINHISTQVDTLGQQLIDRQSDLEVQQILLGQRVRRYYINSQKYNPFLIFFASDQSSSLIQQYSWSQSIISTDRNTIVNYTQDINQINQNKTALEAQKVKLATIKSSFENRFGFLSGEIKKAETYKAELTQKQQSLIAEKTAMFSTAVGDVTSSDDPASAVSFNPGFSPAFAVFSFGAPHRKGMSQYGAFGRAKAGQNMETILKAYYGNIKIEKMDSPSSIKTTVGTIPFEDNYLLGIAEMPASWGDQGGYEALKAQAIAARTYAINSTNNLSGTICVTEACQVYSHSRLDNPGRWRQAVQDTRGMVVKSNQTNNIFSTMYASTSGGATTSYSSNGHSTPQLWDTSCGNQSCWPGSSFENQAGSPWFYKGWYKTRSNLTGGRSNPWLTNDEFADIINAQIYFSKTHDSSHLSQVQNCLGSCDNNAWSRDELRRQVADKGGPVSNINSVSVDYSTSGYTQTIRLSTDKGDFSFNGSDFGNTYTLRAPGALTAQSSLYNIEKK